MSILELDAELEIPETTNQTKRKNTDDDDDLCFAFQNVNNKLKIVNLNNLLQSRKLLLVLDLDHTLVHSVLRCKLTPAERLLYADNDNLPYSVTRLDHIYTITKLRPFVHSFLKQASELFEMYICTMGGRGYALEMAKLIDPDNVYFDNYSRITAKEDFRFRNRKSLDVIMGKENERAVVILDDTENVWENNKGNLIVPQSYNYFAAEKDKRLSPTSHSVLKTDENQGPGTLETALEVLRCIHGEFFDVDDQDEGLAHQDVRRVMGMMVGENNSEKTLRLSNMQAFWRSRGSGRSLADTMDSVIVSVSLTYRSTWCIISSMVYRMLDCAIH